MMMTILLAQSVTFQRPDLDVAAMLPVLVLGALMVFSLICELQDESEVREEGPGARSLIVWANCAGLALLTGYLLKTPPGVGRETFNGMLVDDLLSRAGTAVIAVCAILALMVGRDELERRKNTNLGEFNALILGASLGMVLMLSAGNTMVTFLGLELFSIALYLLCIFFPERAPSRESGMKYFILSSGASAVLLYGLALLYGATGTTWISEMTPPGASQATTLQLGLHLTGAVLVLTGLLFKLAVVPFHFWAPDVYEGAPTSVTAFMSVATKVAALIALWRMFVLGSPVMELVAGLVLASLAGITILLGNLMALPQTSVKRMLAYSGIANAGYLLLAPVAGNGLEAPMMFFLATYLFGNVGAFIALSIVESQFDREVTREDLRGLFLTRPWLAVGFGVCLVSLAGIPPAAGFVGKFYLFGRAIAAGKLVLPAIAIIGSLLGCAYYLGTAISMFDRKLVGKAQESEDSEDSLSSSEAALAICVAGILLLGVVPGSLISWLSAGLPVF